VPRAIAYAINFPICLRDYSDKLSHSLLVLNNASFNFDAPYRRKLQF